MTRLRSTLRHAAALAIAALFCVAACAQQEPLATPPGRPSRAWMQLPMPYAQPQGGTLVSFKSPRAGGQELEIKAVVFKPPGEAKAAVVIVNAADGWSDVREGHYARSISSAGYTVLVIDTYGARSVKSTSNDNTAISLYEQMRDAFAAKRYLVSQGYPADRMALMGSGRGGTVALLVADRTFLPSEKADRFALVMAVGATCFLHPRQPKPSAQVFIAIGDKDDVTGVKPCETLGSEYTAAGGSSLVKVYSGATTAFDGDPKDRVMYRNPTIESLANCNVVVEPDGRFNYDGKTFAETDPAVLFPEMRKSCIKPGASIYTNVTQKANVTLDLIDFLDANFRH
ncbi:dienelactone hydrolase family protein [Variovorax sp. dw_954]|uniref:dienelactone hydrolase family protein n=1 Tax=Variovorax sp. dw_954 TaxID=2720078 RepID=UPI001BD66E99|nr:dienelactone hydrolase family protein [Variovorax sp. dw_954]